MPSESEQALVESALRGDQQAYRTLFEANRRAIFNVVVRIVRNPEEANDLVQETFIKAFGSLKSYNSDYRFSTWLYRIAANSAIDALRKRKMEALSLDRPIATKNGDVKMEVADYSYHPERDLKTKQQRTSIEEAIGALPDKYREVIIMRHKEDKSYDDIARLLNVPVGTVKARIFRARELLKKKLKSLM